MSTTKTADSATAAAGGADGYTITVHNPNTQAVSLDAVTDTLPDGFSYQTGSTTGATTADPSISGQQLSWAGPISVPASGDASIHFAVTVASTSGTYFNNAGAVAEGFTVASTGGHRAYHRRRGGDASLVVTTDGNGTGTVTSIPTGIDCGTTCSATFDDGTPVDLTATPGVGSTFAGWSGDCSGMEQCSVTMDADHAVTATFTAAGTDVPGAPTDVTAIQEDGSALVGWTAPASDGGSAIDSYTVTCTAGRRRRALGDGRWPTPSTPVTGLTNGVEYSCTATAHNVNGDSEPSEASRPFTPTGSQAQFSMTVDTSVGGILLINPEGPNNLGTTGKIKIPPQFGPSQQVVVTASLFGIPGETDATCGGNVCIGQGIEWSVSNPSAIKKMRIKFIEAKTLTHGGSAQNAVAYKDGVPVANCPVGVSDKNAPKPCVVWRYDIHGGGWQVTLLVDGSDPKGGSKPDRVRLAPRRIDVRACPRATRRAASDRLIEGSRRAREGPA